MSEYGRFVSARTRTQVCRCICVQIHNTQAYVCYLSQMNERVDGRSGMYHAHCIAIIARTDTDASTTTASASCNRCIYYCIDHLLRHVVDIAAMQDMLGLATCP